MNQLADGEVQSQIQCSQRNVSKKKNKKAKDPEEATEDVAVINQESLSESLANTLHLNNINSNITNGTSVHLADGETAEPAATDGNRIPCSDTGSAAEASSQMHIVRNLVEEALENLENALNTPEQPQDDVDIISYESELQMPEIMRLIQKDLSEPYSIYTYRYFIHNWPKLCFLATHEGKCIGAIVCKLDMHRNVVRRGYIAMLAVDEKYRKRKIGSRLVQKAIQVCHALNYCLTLFHHNLLIKPLLTAVSISRKRSEWC